ncbi:MAG: interleukin-like EMT inducer domain-containing protein [Anaerolineae bacterium]
MKSYRSHLFVVGFYGLTALALTWPWIANFATAFPGSDTWAFDESTFVWNMWWFKHSLLDLGQSPLHSDFIFYPLGIDLVLYTYNLLNTLLGLPLQLALNLPLAANLALLFQYVFSGYGTYLLAGYLLADRPDGPPAAGSRARVRLAALVAGLAYMLGASRAIYAALGHYDIVSTAFIPFYALYLLKTLRGPGFKNPFLAGVFAALCLLAEMIFGVFLLFLSLILIGFELRRRRGALPVGYVPSSPAHLVQRVSPAGYRLVRWLPRLLALGLTAGILWGPVMVPILRAFADEDFALRGWGEGLKLSADLVGLMTPTALHPIWGADWRAELRAVVEGTARFRDVNTVFLGYGALALAGLAAITRWRRVRAWVWSAGVFAVLSLGPLLQINGRFLFPFDNLLREQSIPQDVTVPLPYALLHYLPIIKANRVPNRFSVVLGLALAVLVGYGAHWVLRKIQNPKSKIQNLIVAGVLVVFVLFDQLALPLPLTSARVPPVYADIAAEPGEFALLQLPLGWRNSFGVVGAERTQLQYYQAVHRRPMVGGNISRAPAFKFDYFQDIPLFRALTGTELPLNDPPVEAETLARARQQAADLMALYNIRYLVIHEPIPGRKPYEDTYAATRQLAFELLPLEAEPAYAGDGVAAYRVRQPPLPPTLRLDFGHWTGAPYRGEGWAADETIFAASANWTVAAEARVFFPVRGPGDRRLALQVAPFTYPDAPSQTLRLSLNGQPLAAAFPLQEGWQVIETTLPAGALRQGLNVLALRPAYAVAPRDVLPPQTAIGATGALAPLDIEVNSSADFAFITVGFGPDAIDASGHRRGLNLAVLGPDDGRVLFRGGFDTAANSFEADRLAERLARVEPGHIVVVASQGLEAAAFLHEPALAALGSIGADTSRLAPPFSIIGVKGAGPGTALQVVDGAGSAYLRLGPSPDTRSLGVAVDWVEIRQD